MKFYQKRGFALVVLVLAILGSCVYGISKKPADLPQVSYGNWLRDDADLLTDETEASLRQYDQSWDSDYRAIIANLGSKSVSRVEISVTIPEGYTVMQIFKLLEEKGVATVEDLNETETA